MTELLLTEKETCDRLSMGRSTLRRLMAEGAIKSVHVGRSLRFPAQELVRFVEGLEPDSNGREV